MRFAISVLLFFTLTLPAAAWNDKGHMIIARLAWNQLSEAERAKAISILKRHPDFLSMACASVHSFHGLT